MKTLAPLLRALANSTSHASRNALGSSRRRRRTGRLRLQFEPLEVRTLLATWSGDVFDTAPGMPRWTNAEIQHVAGNVHVPAGKTLTIQPGTVVQFDVGTNLTVDGTLIADGNSGQSIYLTSYADNSPAGGANNAGRGDWGAITFSGTSSGNVLDHAEVRYGGYSGGNLEAAVIDDGPLTMTDSVVSNSWTAGLRLVSSAPTVAGVAFSNNRGAAVSMDLASQPIIGSPTFTNNAVNGVQVDAGTLPGNVTWNSPGVVYRLSGDTTVPAGVTLTIGAGQVIKMPYSGSSIFTSNGTLKALGTAEAPIIFTGERDDSVGGDTNNNAAVNAPAAGDWYYLQFGGNSVGNVLDHVEVRYGGFGASGEVVDQGGELTVTDSVLRDSANAGLGMNLASQPTIRGTTFLNNRVNGVQVDAGTLPGNVTWNNPGVVYRLSGDTTVPAGVTLTIGAGQVIKMPYSGSSIFTSNGTLKAFGTAEAPIIFTSERDDSVGGDTNNNAAANAPAAGDWYYLRFGSDSVGNVLDHVEVRYGGYGAGGEVVDQGGELTVTNSILRNSANAGLSMSLPSQPTIRGTTFVDNHFNGIQLDAGTLPRDITWNNPDVIYRLSGDTTVPTGVTLTIGAGQAVQIGSNLFVQGTLHALGESDAPVIFTSVRDASPVGGANTAGYGDWGAILFDTGSAGNFMDHTEVRYGGCYDDNLTHGAIMANGALTLSNSVVRDGKCVGVSVGSGADATLISNLIFYNTTGIEAEAGARLTAVNNTIDDNQYGIVLESATATLTNNLITNNGQPTASGATGGGMVVTGATSLTMSFNDVFNSPQFDYYHGQGDQTGLNGNLSVDPRYFNAANRQYQLRPGSPLEDAGTSNGAPATDIFGNPRFDDPNITGRGDNSGYDMGAMEVQQVATSNVDLATFAVSGPATGSQGMTATVNWTVKNIGSGAATGAWSDAVYLSDTPVWTPDAKFLKRVPHTGDLGPEQSYAASTDVVLNGILPGNHFLLVRANDANEVFEGLATANNTAAASPPVNFAMPTLTLNTPLNDQFTGAGQSRYYQITVAAGQTLSFALQSAASGGSTELYVSRGSLPSRSQFDFGGGALAPNQQVIVPWTQPGTYYVLAYSAYGSAATSPFTLTAAQAVFGVQSVSPATVGNSGQVTLTIAGAQFHADAQAILIAPDNSVIAAASTRLVDSTHVQAVFNLAGKPVGSYDVRIAQGAETATASDALNVSAGVTGHLKVDFIVPGSIRAGHQGTVTVEYTNDGGADLPAPILDVTSTSPTLRFTTDANSRGDTAEFLAINPTGDAGVLPPGARGSVQLYFVASTDTNSGTLQFTLTSQSSQADAAVLDWSAAKALLRPSSVPVDAWDAVYANFMADAGTTLGSFQALLDRQATYLSRLGEYTGDEGRLLALEFQQAGNFGAIVQRYNLGVFGRGIPDPTVFTATADADGDVTILAGTQTRVFVRQPNQSYRGGTGDFGVLTRVNGAYRLREPDGTLVAFRNDGRFDYREDTNGNRVTANYSGHRLTSFVDNFGNTTSLTYNDQGRVSQWSDPVGRTTSFTYDAAAEHLLAVSNAQGTTRFSYVSGQGPQSEHAVQSITYQDGTHSFFTYDARGRLTRSTRDGGANELDYAYDGIGGVTVTNALNHGSTTLVNEAGQPALMQDALGNVTRFLYDANRNLAQIVRPDGSTASITSDNRGNPTSAVDALGRRVDATFDSAFNTLQTLRDPRGNSLSFRSDARGNPLSLTYPDGSSERFTYDESGNVVKRVDRLGQETRFTYDAHNLLIGEDFTDGTHAEFAYDAHRNLTTATNNGGTTSFVYDPTTDRLTKATYPDGRFLSFNYDAAGRRTSSIDQDGFAVTYHYDGLGRLRSLEGGDGAQIVTYTFNSVGQLQRQDMGNGTFTTTDFDANGRVLSLVNRAPGGQILSRFDYAYDALGRVITMSTTDGTTTYGYDAVGQLTSVILPSGRMIDYKYDAAGNRVFVADNDVTTTYSTNNLNQYTNAGSAQLKYDANGNLLSRTDTEGTTTYVYNLQGQLASVTTPTDSFAYIYDAVGFRTAVLHNGVRTSYLIDPTGLGTIVGEYGDGGQLIAHYTQGAGLTSRVDSNGAAFYYAFDRNGNTSLLTAPDGTVVNRYRYLPYGETLFQDGSLPNVFTFGGQFGVMSESSGLSFVRARYYDSDTGRFIVPDPIGSAGGLNLYGYAQNDPVNRTDLTGFSLVDLLWAINFHIVDTGGQVLRNGQWVNEILRSLTKEQLINFARNEGVSDAMIKYALGEGPKPPGIGPAAVRTVTAGGTETVASIETAETVVTTTEAVETTVAVEAGGTAAGGAAAGGTAAGGGAGAGVAGPLGLVLVGVVGATYAANRGAETGHSFNDAVADSFFNGEVKPSDKVIARCQELGFSGANNACITALRELKGRKYANPVYPHDPNDLTGPLGFGVQHFVTPDQTFPYTILFENQPGATAPALVVQVTQQLDAKLDWSTFELGDFGFGKYTVHVPAGRRFFSTRVDARETRDEFVDVTASFDPSTGQATWLFTSIDPATGALPEGATDGFLPPDDAVGSGQGFINYRIRPRTVAVTGTTVPAQARVYFDAGLPSQSFLDTPTFTNTFDLGGPASTVAALPSSTPSPFTVHWSGHDDASGSGIATFDVYVATDGGPFLLWLDDTAATSHSYPGELGHTYGFYSVATDNVGHQELAVPAAQTQTTVIAGPRWQNSAHFEDVNVDTLVSPIDALLIINELNLPSITGPGGLLPDTSSPPPFFDVNGDSFVSPVDALLVINVLNGLVTGEGEFAEAQFVPPVVVVEMNAPAGNFPSDSREGFDPPRRADAGLPPCVSASLVPRPVGGDQPARRANLEVNMIFGRKWRELVDEVFGETEANERKRTKK